MLDREGFRPNVGIILLNQKSQVFWGKRIRTHSWQFPQGGIDRGENPEQAMFRELHEEVGLQPQHVQVLARTRDWLRYEVPDRFIRRDARGHYRGQKQIWFLLQLTGRDWDLNLRATSHPEFDAWRWNDYWVPLDVVVEFKRGVYEMALTELSRFVPRWSPPAHVQNGPDMRIDDRPDLRIDSNRGELQMHQQHQHQHQPQRALHSNPMGLGADAFGANLHSGGLGEAAAAAAASSGQTLVYLRHTTFRLSASFELPPGATFEPDPQTGIARQHQALAAAAAATSTTATSAATPTTAGTTAAPTTALTPTPAAALEPGAALLPLAALSAALSASLSATPALAPSSAACIPPAPAGHQPATPSP